VEGGALEDVGSGTGVGSASGSGSGATASPSGWAPRNEVSGRAEAADAEAGKLAPKARHTRPKIRMPRSLADRGSLWPVSDEKPTLGGGGR
jgi:hypothetical protein